MLFYLQIIWNCQHIHFNFTCLNVHIAYANKFINLIYWFHLCSLLCYCTISTIFSYLAPSSWYKCILNSHIFFRRPAFALCRNVEVVDIVRSYELEILTLAGLSSLKVCLCVIWLCCFYGLSYHIGSTLLHVVCYIPWSTFNWLAFTISVSVGLCFQIFIGFFIYLLLHFPIYLALRIAIFVSACHTHLCITP